MSKDPLIYFAPRRGYYKPIRLPRSTFGENESRADSLRNKGPGTLAELYPAINQAMAEGSYLDCMGSHIHGDGIITSPNVIFNVLPGCPEEVIIDSVTVLCDVAATITLWRDEVNLGTLAPEESAKARAKEHGVLAAVWGKFATGNIAIAAATGRQVWQASILANTPVPVYRNAGLDEFRMKPNHSMYTVLKVANNIRVTLQVDFREPLSGEHFGAGGILP